MAGLRFAYRESGAPPKKKRYSLAKSMTGTGTRPAAQLRAEDVVALTDLPALTTSSNQVVRHLLAADRTANYENGSGVRCGVLGVCISTVDTTSGGKVSAAQSNGGAILRTQGMASMNPLDSNGHAQQTFIVATPDTVFRAQLTTAAASAAAYLALKGTSAGLTITDAGVVDYTVLTSDNNGEKALLTIVEIDPLDTTFKTVFVKFKGFSDSPGGSYCQGDTGTQYTAQ